MRSLISNDYFELFGLPVAYEVDVDRLEQGYRRLQRTLHPDKFATATDQERRLSLQSTAFVNEAFQTLKNPVRRARYLLDLRNINPDDAGITVGKEFLIQQMELRERLADIADNSRAGKELHEMRATLEKFGKEKEDQFGLQYEIGTPDADNNAARLFLEMQFIDKLLREIGDLEAEIIR